MDFLIQRSQYFHRVETVVISTLQLKQTLRPREIQLPDRGYTARKWQNGDADSVSLALAPRLFTLCLQPGNGEGSDNVCLAELQESRASVSIKGA